MSSTAAPLLSAIHAVGDELLLVVTGAGISLASGIPTFRGTDPGAVWATSTTELGTLEYFQRDPAGSWKWYLTRLEAVVRGPVPNAGHRALVDLERWHVGRGGRFLLVTQNVDTLHEEAGTQELVKVHGSWDRVRCSRITCRLGAPSGSIARRDVDVTAFLADPVDANVPRCPACRSRLRQHVLWFDELYTSHADYQFERVRRAAKQARLVIFVGTSFSVGITDLILEQALGRGVPVFSIDPGGVRPDPAVQVLREPAETLLPTLVYY